MKNLPIVIIGNGIAANSALRAIRGLDRERPVVLVSYESEPAHSACVLSNYIAGGLSRQQVFFRSLEDYKRLGVELLLQRQALSIDPAKKEVELDDRRLPYHRLIIATGSQAIIPAVPGRELSGNFVVKSITDADAILNYPASCYIVAGSGPVGVEVSVALKQRQGLVTLVEQLDQILPKVFEPGPARRIQTWLNHKGVEVRTGTTVTAVHGQDRVVGVELDGQKVACDGIIWAVGMKPRVELAQQAGLMIGSTGGIKTDLTMRTSDPDIFACGDCAETVDTITGKPVLSMLWPGAAHQGAVAGCGCAGFPKEFPGSTFQMVIEFAGLSAGAVGLTGQAGGPGVTVLERPGLNDYHVLVIDQEERVIGAQSLNNLNYLGPVQGIIRQKVRLDQWEETLMSSPGLKRAVPWAWQVLRLVRS